nr:MAG TPA: hypothetical protein [Caudoviricetes sp.]
MGRVIVSGGGRMELPPTLATLEEGSIVTINENGSPVEFYVAKQDYESGLNGGGRVLVVRKDYYTNNYWYVGGTNEYPPSTINSYLNNDYLNILSTGLRNKVGKTKFKIAEGNGSGTVVNYEQSVFVLSLTELGLSHTYAPVLGDPLNIASTLNISTATQWTRTAETGETTNVYAVAPSGGYSRSDIGNRYGYRPCFTLPSTTLIKNGAVVE